MASARPRPKRRTGDPLSKLSDRREELGHHRTRSPSAIAPPTTSPM
jgi:hypothetical protein